MTKKDFYLKAVIETYAALLRNSGVSIPSVRQGDCPEDENVFTMEDALDATDHLQEQAINLACCLTARVEEDSCTFGVIEEGESIFEEEGDPKPFGEYDKYPVDDIFFSNSNATVRFERVCKNNNFKTVGDLLRCGSRRFKSFPQCGRLTTYCVQDYLRAHFNVEWNEETTRI